MARGPAKTSPKSRATPRKRSARKTVAAPSKVEAPAPRRPRVSLPSLESGSTRLRKVILNIAFVLAIIVFIPILATQFLRNPVLIEPIAVPKALVARGITPEVVASRLWDGLRDAGTLARTSKASVDAVPNSQRVQFSVPEVGLSLDSVIRQTRQFFNLHETVISGEFTCADTACTPSGMQLRLRISRGATEVVDMPALAAEDFRTYFRDAAVQILTSLDPFVAIAAISSTEPVKAITMARRLIRQGHPDSKWAHVLIGNIRSESGDDRAAVPEYQAALAIDPGFFIPKANLAAALRRLGDPAASRKLYDELAQSHPENAKANEGYAELAAGAGRPDEAIDFFKRAIAQDASNAIYPFRIGEIEYGRGNIEPARDWFRAALQRDPTFWPATQAMFVDYISRGDFAGIEPMLKAAVDYDPQSAPAHATYAFVLIMQNRPEEALAVLDAGLALTPNDTDMLFQSARMLQDLNRLDEAKARLDRAIALNPYNPSYFSARAMTNTVLGHTREAIADFQRTIDVDPTHMYDATSKPLIEMLQKQLAEQEAAPVPEPEATAP